MLNVQADPDDTRRLTSEFFEMIRQGAEHASPPEFGLHEDTLDPPDIAVTPVAPLEGVHHLADNLAVNLSDEVASSRRGFQQCLNTSPNSLAIKRLALRFGSQFEVECRNRRGIAEVGRTDSNRIE